MKVLHKFMSLVLCLSLTAFSLPVLAAGASGSVDATMSEYVKFDPTKPPIAEAVVSNRSNITVPYILEVMDINGVALEELASGELEPGETKIISGSATVLNKSSVRVKVGTTGGLQAIDTAWLITRR